MPDAFLLMVIKNIAHNAAWHNNCKKFIGYLPAEYLAEAGMPWPNTVAVIYLT